MFCEKVITRRYCIKNRSQGRPSFLVMRVDSLHLAPKLKIRQGQYIVNVTSVSVYSFCMITYWLLLHAKYCHDAQHPLIGETWPTSGLASAYTEDRLKFKPFVCFNNPAYVMLAK